MSKMHKWINYLNALKKKFFLVFSLSDENQEDEKTCIDIKNQIVPFVENVPGYNGYYTINLQTKAYDTNTLINILTDLNCQGEQRQNKEDNFGDDRSEFEVV